MNKHDIRHSLFKTLTGRHRPEDVALSVRQLLGDELSYAERATIATATRGSLSTGPFGFSAMSTTFREVVGFERQFSKAKELFAVEPPIAGKGVRNQLETARNFIASAAREIGHADNSFDFKSDRLNEEARKSAGIDISRRQYNKLFRFVARLQAKVGRVERELKLRELTMIGNARLACDISREQFCADDNTAAFVSYYVARSSLRSEFTIEGQQRAFDEIAEMLFNRCLLSPNTRWSVIAMVYSPPHVVRRLSPHEQSQLMIRWFSVLEHAAAILRELWESNQFRRDSMVVKKGDDSSTWNQVANAWNKGRDAWFALLDAMDCSRGLERFCPGKVMRLMAGDVAAWHRESGGDLDPQTKVWASLPLPWMVIAGDEECPLKEVHTACARFGIDPIASGWTNARKGNAVSEFKPTPELVHGVDVGHPKLAQLFRRWGVFSGKTPTNLLN